MPYRRLLLPLLVSMIGALGFAACATGVSTTPNSGTGGAGGDSPNTVAGPTSASGTTTNASGKAAASVTAVGSSSTGVPATCMVKADCVGDDDACNTGNCVNSVCVKAPANEGAACDDGMFCTDNDACAMGMCVGGTPKFCPSPDTCHVGACDEGTKACGSAPGNDGASCDDGDPCTYSGICSAGTCSKGMPVDCSNFNSTCSDGVCDPVLGCEAKPKNDGSPCDDGLFCTNMDVCTNGVCGGVPNMCAPPGDICMIGTCNEAMKSCVSVPGNNGLACNDGNPCHVSAKCNAGVCGGGVAGNNGLACNDGNGCDVGTTCSGGVCGNPTMKISQCIAGDKCCPAACNQVNDNDCIPNFCATFKYMVGTTGVVGPPAPFTCPSNATQWCDMVPIDATSATQAAKACQVCFGAPCTLINGDCAGPGYGKNGTGPTFGYQGGGCSMEPAGRIWNDGESYQYYGTWAP